MRLRGCVAALRAFVRRLGVYLLVLAIVAGAGASTPLQVIAALAGWTVMPLFNTATHGAWLLAGATLQAMFGGALVWGARALPWPLRWAEAERALPIDVALP
jgi:hypothetical protein